MEENWQKIEPTQSNIWDFNAQPDMIGTYVRKEQEIGPNNSNLYTFRMADGEEISVWGSTLIDNRMVRVELGNEVKIVYLGKVKSEKSNREYHNYEIYFRPAEKGDEEIPSIESEELEF